MTHPHENDLALFAGGDLGYFRRRRVGRHVDQCPQCRAEVEEFTLLRSELRSLEEMPEVRWSRIAAEMKANIHVGLEAGACVPDERPGLFSPGRAWAAYGALLAVLFLALWVGRPIKVQAPTADDHSVVLAATGDSIEMKHAGSSLSLIHAGARDVTLSVGAQGSMRARYVDSQTGQVTINNVYVQ